MSRVRDSKGRYAQQNVGSPWILPNREPTPELFPQVVSGISGQPGVFDQIMVGHPKVAKHMSDFRTTLGAASYWWQPCEDETSAEAAFREDMESLCKGAYLDAENGVQGWSEIAESWLQHWAHGMYWAEVRWVEEPTEARQYAYLSGRQLELYPVHPSTVQQVLQSDNYRRLTGIRQSASTGFAEIPVERLLWVQRGGIVGQYAGESILRPLVFLFDRWRSVWLSSEQQAYMQGGCLVVQADQAANYGTEAWKRARATLEGWQNNLARYLLMPPGFQAEFIAASSSIDGDVIDRIDAYCDTVLGAQVAALIQSANGHRALGEVAAAQDDTSQSEDLSAFLRRLGDRLSRWVAQQVAYAGRRPTLSVRPAEQVTAPDAKVATAIQAKGAQAVTWTSADEAWVRETIGMPELQTVEDVDGDSLLAEPMATPIPPEPDGSVQSAEMAEVKRYEHIDFTPPQGVREAAARGLEVRREAPESQRGGTEVGVARARDLSNGVSISPETARRMKAYFDRHEADKQGETWDQQGKGWQAWMLWGGDAGRSWAEKLVKQMNAADEKASLSDSTDPVPPAAVQQSAADGLFARGRSPSEMRGLQNRMDLQLAKKIAAGQGLSRGELRYIESALRFIGDPTTKPDYGLHGPTYQEFHGLGGQAMVSWLGGVLSDTDGVAPVTSPDPTVAPEPMAEPDLLAGADYGADFTGRWC
jgi:hypothetical protein